MAGWILPLSVALAQEPAPAPAPAAPAPAAPASAAPAIGDLDGTWYVTSSVDGAEVVDWGCARPPDTLEFGDGYVVLVVGGETNGGAIKSSAARGASLALTTSIATCSGTKELAFSWADAAHRIAAINRCAGTPRSVRAVRNASSGVRVTRQCCDPSGRMTKRVGANDPCPAGSEGMKPNPLRP